MYGLKDFKPPVAGEYRITSGEGTRKSKATTNGQKMSKFHYGTDWAGKVPGSTPDIVNITSGKVVYTGNAGGYGNVVIVENPDGYKIQYGHLNSIDVKVGDIIPAGGKIGVMGSTGNVTGTHLDLVVTKNGKTLNRDGSVLVDNVPRTLSKIGTSSPVKATSPQTATIAKAEQPNIVASGTSEPTTILSSVNGLVVPDTETQNKLFSGIANMHLDGGLEGIYAEAGRAIANAMDSMDGEPMIKQQDPLIQELSVMFDNIDV